VSRAEIEATYRQFARLTQSGLLIGLGFFVAGGIAYSAGGSVLWAWAGLVAFAALASASTILLSICVRKDGQVLGKLQAENKARRAAEARRIEVELRLADVHALVEHTMKRDADGDVDEDWMEGVEQELGGGFFSSLDHALRGDPGHGDRTEMAVARRQAHVKYRDYLEFPELPPIDVPSEEEL
jgi:hypothetical protein